MNRLFKCISFQMYRFFKSALTFLGIYIAIFFIVVLMLTNSNATGSFNSSFFIAGSIFIFVSVISSYKITFNYLMMFGNTRKNIILSSFVTYILFSAFFSIVSILSELMDSMVTKAFHHFSNFSILSILYKSNTNWVSEMVWFMALFILISSLSMLYGSLAYKFGKIFSTIFWVGFGLSWMLLPVFASVNGQSTFFNAIKAYFCAGDPNGILLAPVNFIISAVIFAAITYVISTKQPQVA